MEFKAALGLSSVAFALVCQPTVSFADPVTLSGDYIRIGTNERGTLGSGGNTSPGILFDGTGTGTFNASYDYLTPGAPYAGFAITATYDSTQYAAHNNNNGTEQFTTISFTDTSEGTTNSVQWVGSYSTDADVELYKVTNTISFDDSAQQITMRSKITATENLEDIYFASFTDPDARAADGDSSVTNNFRGSDDIDPSKLIYAEALASKYVIGLYSEDDEGVNTAVTRPWSSDPEDYYNGNEIVTNQGDDAIGIGFYKDSLAAEEEYTFEYAYIFGTDILVALEEAGASPAPSSTSVYTATVNANKTSAVPAAEIIQQNSVLRQMFTGMSDTNEIANAVETTLPTITGGVAQASGFSTEAIASIIAARQDLVRGISSGDNMFEDRYAWIKPFGGWTKQSADQGVAGYRIDSYGLVMGFDGTVAPTCELGLALAYSHGDVESDSTSMVHNVDIDNYLVKLYGTKMLSDLTAFNMQLGYAVSSYKSQRHLFNFSKANASYRGWQVQASANLEHSFPINHQWVLTPYIYIDYSYVSVDGYQENGAGLLNLVVNKNSTDKLVLGGALKAGLSLDRAWLINTELGAGYDFLTERSNLTSSFAGGGAQFSTLGIKPDELVYHAKIDAQYKLNQDTELTASYKFKGRNHYTDQSVSLNLRWLF